MGKVIRLVREGDQGDIAAGLCRHFEASGLEPQRIDTHLSSVVLVGDRAYKVKKAVRHDFVDFRTFAQRRQACLEEVRLNQRLAPDLYLGVVALHAQGDRIAPHPPGPIVETAVLMRRLPPLSLASERLARGTLQAADLSCLAARLADFQHEAPVASAVLGWGTADRVIAQMRATCAALAPALDARLASLLQGWIAHQAERLRATFDRRLADGHVREGHGDLHLDNIVVAAPGDVTAFDALEFDPSLRWIDTQADLAFVVMDLLAHGRRDLAYGFLNDVLERSGDYDGVTVLRWYVMWRAMIRARVVRLRDAAANDGSSLRAPDHAALIRRLLVNPRGCLLITRGLPGSGKTHLTRRLLERVGALRLRSDVERRRLFPSLQGRYVAEATLATYRHLAERTSVLLTAGCPVIVDASFGRRAQREVLREAAVRAGVPCTVLDCRAPMEVLQARVIGRRREGVDASEANLDVLLAAAKSQDPLDPGEFADVIEVDTSKPIAMAMLVHRWLCGPVAVAH